MPTIKARKGNPFEKDVAFSLMESYYVSRPDDNSPGVDLVAYSNNSDYYIECKNYKRLSWNQLVTFYEKTKKYVTEKTKTINPNVYVVFHTNRQPVLAMWKPAGRNYIITTFEDAFGVEFKKRPKGYKFWVKEQPLRY